MNQTYREYSETYFLFVKCEICGGQSKTFPAWEDAEEANWKTPACESARRAWNMRKQ